MAVSVSDITGDMALSRKGSFSYLHDNVNYVQLDPNLTARIERINNNVARLYLVVNNAVQQPVPAHITVTDGGGQQVPPFMNNFLITWVDSYTVHVNGNVFIRLNNQKQQSISAPASAASGLV